MHRLLLATEHVAKLDAFVAQEKGRNRGLALVTIDSFLAEIIRSAEALRSRVAAGYPHPYH